MNQMHHIMHHNVRNKQVKKSIMHIMYRKKKLDYLQKKKDRISHKCFNNKFQHNQKTKNHPINYRITNVIT